MNVLDGGQVPRVMDLRAVLQAFLDHRHEVLIRRTNFRPRKIEQRLEVLGGYLIAYLNLDEVIRIIREEHDAKASRIKAFKRSEAPAEPTLNLLLRRLRKPEEMAVRRGHQHLTTQRSETHPVRK